MKADVTVDCVGLYCPMPIVYTAKKVKEMQPGQVLEVVADYLIRCFHFGAHRIMLYRTKVIFLYNVSTQLSIQGHDLHHLADVLKTMLHVASVTYQFSKAFTVNSVMFTPDSPLLAAPFVLKNISIDNNKTFRKTVKMQLYVEF